MLELSELFDDNLYLLTFELPSNQKKNRKGTLIYHILIISISGPAGNQQTEGWTAEKTIRKDSIEGIFSWKPSNKFIVMRLPDHHLVVVQ